MLKEINEHYHWDEDVAVGHYLSEVDLSHNAKQNIHNKAKTLVENVRKNRTRFGGVDSFLQQFGLTTKEGIALMCLAEALMRIPDSETADALIRDKIGTAEWDKHLGTGRDLFVNASTWALFLTGKVIGDAESQATANTSIQSIISKVGEPVVRQAISHAMKIMGKQFVMERTIERAIKRVRDGEKQGYRYSFDMLGEGARTMKDAERYFKNYADAIDAIGKASSEKDPVAANGISVKLSALHPRFHYSHKETCIPALTDKMLQLAKQCAKYNIGLTIDAEEADRLEMTLEVLGNLIASTELDKQWSGLGIAMQAYQKRCGKALDWLIAHAKQHNRKIMIRLVKGAYWDTEIKHAQMLGLPGYPVFTRKHSTDVAYLANAKKLLQNRDIAYPMFATHNANTVATIIELAGNDQTGFEFQRLHGMGEPLYHQITGKEAGKYPCRVYSPVGNHKDLLPYLVRRLLENGANSSFVNRLQDDKVPVEEITVDPVAYIGKLKSKPHPKIPLPLHIFGTARKNSKGIEFADSTVSDPLLQKLKKLSANTYKHGKIESINPTNTGEAVGSITLFDKTKLETALHTAHNAFPAWEKTAAETRAQFLDRIADLFEDNMEELMSLCTREAGKTLDDAVAEVREAVDFCRYYAEQGRKHFGEGLEMPGYTGESNRLYLQGRGVFLCISPWNFPLAIFTGQITAALMAGNTVIAKPAEPTTLIATRAVELMHQAGIPKDVLHLTPAKGRDIGELIVPDKRIAGVCFTGSTEVASVINRTLAEREGTIIPLIAETGGQNAMIVDSSALPEQVVDDVIASAFLSAGQRCSALRVLYLHEDIADKTIEMLDGACKELTLGNPAKLSTDIGPVIDKSALETLEAHAQKMEAKFKCVAKVELTDECKQGYFFAPRAYEIESIASLEREIFGPILHIVRYKEKELGKVLEEINATGYGLTFGVHSRIEHKINMICNNIHAGNCYVNRSMTGAIVGVQPFGGRGLSGTGPKAGGPHYLMRFATEKTVTINTTASGGNTTLVSLEES